MTSDLSKSAAEKDFLFSMEIEKYTLEATMKLVFPAYCPQPQWAWSLLLAVWIHPAFPGIIPKL